MSADTYCSNNFTLLVDTDPPDPVNPQIHVGCNSVDVEWSVPFSPPGCPVRQYDIELNDEYFNITNTSLLHHSWSDLSPDMLNTLNISAVNGIGPSTQSNNTFITALNPQVIFLDYDVLLNDSNALFTIKAKVNNNCIYSVPTHFYYNASCDANTTVNETWDVSNEQTSYQLPVPIDCLNCTACLIWSNLNSSRTFCNITFNTTQLLFINLQPINNGLNFTCHYRPNSSLWDCGVSVNNSLNDTRSALTFNETIGTVTNLCPGEYDVAMFYVKDGMDYVIEYVTVNISGTSCGTPTPSGTDDNNKNNLLKTKSQTNGESERGDPSHQSSSEMKHNDKGKGQEHSDPLTATPQQKVLQEKLKAPVDLQLKETPHLAKGHGKTTQNSETSFINKDSLANSKDEKEKRTTQEPSTSVEDKKEKRTTQEPSTSVEDKKEKGTTQEPSTSVEDKKEKRTTQEPSTSVEDKKEKGTTQEPSTSVEDKEASMNKGQSDISREGTVNHTEHKSDGGNEAGAGSTSSSVEGSNCVDSSQKGRVLNKDIGGDDVDDEAVDMYVTEGHEATNKQETADMDGFVPSKSADKSIERSKSSDSLKSAAKALRRLSFKTEKKTEETKKLLSTVTDDSDAAHQDLQVPASNDDTRSQFVPK